MNKGINIKRSVKKFENAQVIHRLWNMVSGTTFNLYKKSDGTFIYTTYNREDTNKIYRYFSNDGVNTYGKVSCSLEFTSSVNGISQNYTEYKADLGFFPGFIDNQDYIYGVVPNRNEHYPGVDRGYVIFKSKDTTNYNEFLSVGLAPLPTYMDGPTQRFPAMDNAPRMVFFNNKYFIYGRLRGIGDWGAVPEGYTEDQGKIWLDRRGIRIMSSSAIDSGWGQVSIENLGDLEPTTFDNNYINNTVRQDFYGLAPSEYEGILIGLVDTYFKDENRLPVIRGDRISGTGPEYPTISISTDGYNFSRIEGADGNKNETLTPDTLKRTWDTPSEFENSQLVGGISSSLVEEFGQIGPGSVTTNGDLILGYFGDRIDTHYRAISVYSSSNAGRGDNFISDYSYETASYDPWISDRAEEIETARVTNIENPDFEWRRLDGDTELPKLSDPLPVQKPTWMYVASLRKDGFTSWQKTDLSPSGSVDTRLVEDSNNLIKYLGVNGSGSFSFELLDSDSNVFSVLSSEFNFDETRFIIPLPDEKPPSFKVRTTIYSGDLYAIRMLKGQIPLEDIYLYQLLSMEPTGSTIINWIDDSDSSDGNQHTLYYGTSRTSLTESETSTGILITGTGKYHYKTILNNLSPGTTYYCRVNNGSLNTPIHSFSTFKQTLSSQDTFKIAFVSDIHTDYTTEGSMNSGSRMGHVRQQNPDILCLVGDVVSNSYTTGSSTGNEYIRFFKEHVKQFLNSNREMIPMVNVPGNHDLGERSTVVNQVSPGSNLPTGSGYFQLFWSTFKEYNNSNYGYVKIGDYLKLVGLDLFSATPATNATFFEGLQDDTEYVIPFTHFPILPSTTRETYDQNYFPQVVSNLGPALASNSKVKAYFSGHMHTRYDSDRWTVSQSLSTPPGNYLDLGSDNYLIYTGSIEGKKEFGQGYRNNRALGSFTDSNGNVFGSTGWYVNSVDTSTVQQTYYVVELKPNSELFNVKRFSSSDSGTSLIETFNMLTPDI